jgi:hypothetical protein
MNKPNNKTADTAQATKVLAGTKIHFTTGSTVLPLAGGTKPTTVTDLETALGQLVANRAAVVSAKAALTKAVAVETAAMPALIVLMRAMIAYVRLTLGGDPQALEDFGLAARKVPAPLTAEEKALAAAKRKATREARGTMGPKAKAAIHGNVTAIVVTPVTAPAAVVPAPSAGPATATTPAVASAIKPAS